MGGQLQVWNIEEGFLEEVNLCPVETGKIRLRRNSSLSKGSEVEKYLQEPPGPC